MSEQLKTLQEKRLTLAKDLKDHAATQDKWTAEDKAKWDTLNKAYDDNKAALDAEVANVKAEETERKAIDERLAALEEYKDYEPSARNPRIGRDGAGLDDRHDASGAANYETQTFALQTWMNRGRFPRHVPQNRVDNVRRYLAERADANEFSMGIGDTNRWRASQAPFRIGNRSRGAGGSAASDFDPRNDTLTGKVGTGGTLVGETMLGRLEQALLAYIGVLQVAEILVTDNGETLRWPTMDDTGNTGTRVGEGRDATSGLTSVDPNTGRLSLQAFVFTSGGCNVSRSFLQDNSVNFESMIGGMLGVRIGRKHNVDFSTGADVGNGPIGIVTAATSGVTAASTTALAADEIIDLIHKVDPAYRQDPTEKVGFMFHDLILAVIRKLKDGVGHYLWSAGTTAMEPDRLHGYPYWINQAMDSTIASGKKTLLFGALSKYKVRIVNGLRLQRLVERRAEYDEDVFIAYLRADGGLLDAGTHPVKYLVH